MDNNQTALSCVVKLIADRHNLENEYTEIHSRRAELAQFRIEQTQFLSDVMDECEHIIVKVQTPDGDSYNKCCVCGMTSCFDFGDVVDTIKVPAICMSEREKEALQDKIKSYIPKDLIAKAEEIENKKKEYRKGAKTAREYINSLQAIYNKKKSKLDDELFSIANLLAKNGYCKAVDAPFAFQNFQNNLK